MSYLVGDGVSGLAGTTYVIHSFTTPGSYSFLAPVNVTQVEYLVVGGGGGGGGSASEGVAAGGGGGGGGSVRTNGGGTPFAITSGGLYPASVGAGGSGGTTAEGGSGTGGDGWSSSFSSIVALGGGGGGGYGLSGRAGASGGGGGGRTGASGGRATGGQGSAGGSSVTSADETVAAGGGGGGADDSGASGFAFGSNLGAGGAGGIGVEYKFTGQLLMYGAGGGGAGVTSGGLAGGLGADSRAGAGGFGSEPGGNGVGNSGGGGGGGHTTPGGNGGDGVVVVKYPVAAISTTLGQVSTTADPGTTPPAGGFRMLAAPFPTTLRALLADNGVFTQCFTGATLTASPCGEIIKGQENDPNPGRYGPNVFFWDAVAQEWQEATNINQFLSSGQGVLVYIFSRDAARTLSLTPPVDLEAQTGYVVGTVIPTLASGAGEYTLLGNPYATHLDTDALSRSGVDPTVYVWDPAEEEWDFWTGDPSIGGTGVGDLSGGILEPFQAFFVRNASSGSPALGFSQESMASSTAATGFRGREMASSVVRVEKGASTDPERHPLATMRLDLTAGESKSGTGTPSSLWLTFSGKGTTEHSVTGDALALNPLAGNRLRASIQKGDGEGYVALHLPSHWSGEGNGRLPLTIQGDHGGTVILTVGEPSVSDPAYNAREAGQGSEGSLPRLYLIDLWRHASWELTPGTSLILEELDAAEGRAVADGAVHGALTGMGGSEVTTTPVHLAPVAASMKHTATSRFYISTHPLNVTSTQEQTGSPNPNACDDIATSDGDRCTPELPTRLTLLQNSPNPFNPTTTIRFGLSRHSPSVSLELFDLQGRKVMTLLDGVSRPAGWHEIPLDAATLPSGRYLCRLSDAGEMATVQITLVK